ncbi:retrovirus-related Pol polyprotein from transposon 412 [Trichonephila clavipes]|nr:retrovirus-related Pol polyprotein from transposon 412 [Trichonephila clavipes]
MEDAKQKQKLWYNRRTVKRQFQLGELVLVIAPSRPNKLSVQWVGLGEIVQQLFEHDIELESERAIVSKPYRMSSRQIEILKSEVNKMFELKIIEPGESDFTFPLILVEAQGKEARPCIDYRRLNKVTRTQFFPLPNIEELLEKVSAANISLSWILLEGIGKYP